MIEARTQQKKIMYGPVDIEVCFFLFLFCRLFAFVIHFVNERVILAQMEDIIL